MSESQQSKSNVILDTMASFKIKKEDIGEFAEEIKKYNAKAKSKPISVNKGKKNTQKELADLYEAIIQCVGYDEEKCEKVVSEFVAAGYINKAQGKQLVKKVIGHLEEKKSKDALDAFGVGGPFSDNDKSLYAEVRDVVPPGKRDGATKDGVSQKGEVEALDPSVVYSVPDKSKKSGEREKKSGPVKELGPVYAELDLSNPKQTEALVVERTEYASIVPPERISAASLLQEVLNANLRNSRNGEFVKEVRKNGQIVYKERLDFSLQRPPEQQPSDSKSPVLPARSRKKDDYFKYIFNSSGNLIEIASPSFSFEPSLEDIKRYQEYLSAKAQALGQTAVMSVEVEPVYQNAEPVYVNIGQRRSGDVAVASGQSQESAKNALGQNVILVKNFSRQLLEAFEGDNNVQYADGVNNNATFFNVGKNTFLVSGDGIYIKEGDYPAIELSDAELEKGVKSFFVESIREVQEELRKKQAFSKSREFGDKFVRQTVHPNGLKVGGEDVSRPEVLSVKVPGGEDIKHLLLKSEAGKEKVGYAKSKSSQGEYAVPTVLELKEFLDDITRVNQEAKTPVQRSDNSQERPSSSPNLSKERGWVDVLNDIVNSGAAWVKREGGPELNGQDKCNKVRFSVINSDYIVVSVFDNSGEALHLKIKRPDVKAPSATPGDLVGQIKEENIIGFSSDKSALNADFKKDDNSFGRFKEKLAWIYGGHTTHQEVDGPENREDPWHNKPVTRLAGVPKGSSRS